MRGRGAAGHVRLVGLRSDEERRVRKIESRAFLAEGAEGTNCTVKNQPPGEKVYFPLHSSGIDKAAVARFWQSQSFDLDVPEGAGNCVYCFMKGTGALSNMATRADPRMEPGAPSDPRWWADFEERHARVTPARDGNGTSRFGLLGKNSVSFVEISQGSSAKPGHVERYAHSEPACDCTD